MCIFRSVYFRGAVTIVRKITYSFGCINEDNRSVTYSKRCRHFIREINLTCYNTERLTFTSHSVKLQVFFGCSEYWHFLQYWIVNKACSYVTKFSPTLKFSKVSRLAMYIFVGQRYLRGLIVHLHFSRQRSMWNDTDTPLRANQSDWTETYGSQCTEIYHTLDKSLALCQSWRCE